MNASIGAASFPTIQIGLCFFQTLEAFPFERCLLGMSDGGLDFFFSIGIFNPARQSHHSVVRQHVAIEWIQSGIIEIRDEDAFPQVVENDDAGTATQSTEGSLVQLGPDP